MPRPHRRALTAAIPLLAAGFAVGGLALGGCASTHSGFVPPSAHSFAPQLGIDLSRSGAHEDGLYVQDVRTGTGRAAKDGSLVAFHYTEYLPDGRRFESTHPGPALQLRLGSGKLIRGMREGLEGMKAGGLRKIVVPPQLAYYHQAVHGLPADATLVFVLEMLRVK